ncbi:MAG TPA: twin-arginine translocation signal domain-containing protein [Vicinamibacterales bacterium]|jgi:hypothetical protein|nr:twin-arginine translocation signal domain-containing protein [Vicinamibacterales bacterium]
MTQKRGMQRRDFLAGVAAVGATMAARGPSTLRGPVPPGQSPQVGRKGRIKQAVMRVNFGSGSKLTFDDMCREAASAGYRGFDFVAPQDWPTLKKYGLACTRLKTHGRVQLPTPSIPDDLLPARLSALRR